ncbi:inositol transport system ATP-binding protein [Lachnospiraceae bacterium PF1-21]
MKDKGSSEVCLEMKQIKKSFGSVQALRGVDFKLRRGTVHALMGENGAGKSTLMKILAGVQGYDEGEIQINDKVVAIGSVRDAISAGVSMIHQELSPVLEMSIAENIFLGREKIKGRFPIVNSRFMNKEAAEMMKSQVGMDINPSTKMKELNVAQMQMVEIVKAISQGADIIIMDEPTSAITETEVEKLFTLIRELTEKGKSIIYISHKMDEIFQISDEITVLRDGELVGSDLAKNLDDAKLIKMMVGRELNEVYPKVKVEPGEVLLEVKNLGKTDKFRDISFKVRRGEIVGFAGLVGAGRTEVAEAIFGFKPADNGEICIKGKSVKIKSPADGIKEGIAFVSEDRKEVGLNLISSIKDNITLANLEKYCACNFIINNRVEKQKAQEYSKQFNVKAPSINTKVGQLSGGNQQKVILAKWVSCDPDIIIMDEPTRGIDVGAKSEIYRMMCELAKQGKCIIMISSEMPEVFGMSDRIYVLSHGRLKGVFDKSEFDQENIMACASGKSKEEL